jgi:hypothetical protein
MSYIIHRGKFDIAAMKVALMPAETVAGICLASGTNQKKHINMKWNNKLSLTTIAAIAMTLTMSAFGEDEKPEEKKPEKKEAESKQHENKVEPKKQTHAASPAAEKASQGAVQNQHKTAKSASDQSRDINVKKPSGTAEKSIAARQAVQASQPQRNAANSQRSPGQVSSNQKQYNKDNNYGGLWSAGNTHSDWSRNGQHYWNHHNYRWYDGGWLIVDGGYTPYFSNGGSIVSNVQGRLADQGYYRGPIDGDIGPGTHNAIANYQGDHGLVVTGAINDPLLASLQLE